MMKRFSFLIAIAATMLLAACAQGPSCCKGMTDMKQCCGAVPCRGMAMKDDMQDEGMGKMCDPEMREMMMKKKHHRRHHRGNQPKPAAVVAPAPVSPAAAPAPAPEPVKGGSNVIEGVKKIIKDVKKPE